MQFPDPSTLPLREIHLPESVGWWPPAPGWWLLPVLLALAFAAAWYGGHLYRRRKYSAVNMARRELAEIRSRYAADRDAGRCVRSVSGLLRRVSISVFPRAESAGLTGADWLAFLGTGDRRQGTEDRGRSIILSSLPWRESDRVREKTSGPMQAGSKTGGRERDVAGIIPEQIGKLLLEAPYRQHVAHDEVESLIGFCSGWIESVARRQS